MNSFQWARGSQESKDLILKFGPEWVARLDVKRVMDIASGTNEEIAILAPGADEYWFLDEKFLPPPRPKYRLPPKRQNIIISGSRKGAQD